MKTECIETLKRAIMGILFILLLAVAFPVKTEAAIFPGGCDVPQSDTGWLNSVTEAVRSKYGNKAADTVRTFTTGSYGVGSRPEFWNSRVEGVDLQSSQCCGYANFFFYKICGHNTYNNSYRVDYRAIRTLSAARLKEVLNASKCGAHIRVTGAPHSMVYLFSEANGFYMLHWNYGTVTCSYTTFDGFIRKFGGVGGDFYVDMPNTYPSGDPNVSVSYSDVKTTFVDTWNAGLYGRINNPGRAVISRVGAYVWDSAGACVVNHAENCGLSYSGINQNLNIVGEARPSGLQSGGSYTFQLWAEANGAIFYSGKGSFRVQDRTAPKITGARISNVTSEGYTVSCTVTDNFKVNRVQFPVWTAYKSQDDLCSSWWSSGKASGTRSGNTWSFRVSRSDHNREYGTYCTQIYAYDEAGNYSWVAVSNTALKKGKANQTISAASQTRTLGSWSFWLRARRTKGDGKLSYKSSNTKVATVSGSGRIRIRGVGKATITISAAATSKYNKATKNVTVTVNPKGTSLSGVKNSSSRKMHVSWRRNSAVTGYQVQYASNSKFSGARTLTGKGKSTVKATISGLSKGRRYYVRVRTYKTVSGKKYYSSWSRAKSAVIRK